MSRPKRWQRITLGTLFVAAFATRAGRAGQAPLQLTFDAPPECGSAAQIEQAVATMVRRDGPRLKATVEITRVGERYLAVIRTEPAAERSLEASDCRAVVEASSVVLALAIDPNARLGAAAQRAERPPPATASPHRMQPTLAAAIAFDSSTLPRADIGATLGAGLAWPRWSAWFKLTAWNAQDAVSASTPSRGGRFTWWTGALSVCSAPLRYSWAALCVSPEIGRLAGAGIGDGVARRSAASLWFAVGAGPALEWRFAGPWALRSEAQAVLTVLGRHPFVWEVADSTGPSTLLVHQPGRVSARMYLGLAARF